MTASGDLSGNQEKVLAALLATATVAAAAEMSGISERTVYRYLRDPGFRACYREARAAMMDQSVAALQKVSIEAVAVLRGAFKSENPHARIRAAKTVLDAMFKGTELVDMEERLRRLEKGAGGE